MNQKTPVEHCCKASDHPDANIRCVSATDSTRYFYLFWVDGPSLFVEYCPFCGANASKINEMKEPEIMIDHEKILEQINDKYAFLPDGKMIPREEYDLLCKETMLQQLKEWGYHREMVKE